MKQHWLNYQREIASHFVSIASDVRTESEWHSQLQGIFHAERVRKSQQRRMAPRGLPGIERLR